MKTTLYKDTESGELVSLETLSKEFRELKAEAPEEYDSIVVKSLMADPSLP